MYEKKCRVCLTEFSDGLLSLFAPSESINNSLTNADLIMACSSVHVFKNDGYPQNICRNCYKQLLQSYKFKLLCENSDKILRSVVKQEEIPPENDNTDYVDDNDDRDDRDDIIATEDTNLKPNLKEETKDISKDLDVLLTYTCPLCSKVYKDNFLYSQHVSYCKSKKPSPSGGTNIKTNPHSVPNIKIKMSSVPNVKPTSEKILLSNNMRMKIRYACSKCKKNFNTKDELKHHFEKYHPQSRPAIFTDTNKFNNVIRKALSNVKPPPSSAPQKPPKKEKPRLHCSLCDENYDSIVKHYQHKHKLKECSKCGKICNKFSNFYRHMRGDCVSTSQHLCPYCGRCFKEQGNLKCHMRTHTGEKPYECEVCKRKFAQWSSLWSHRVIHTGEKNFACEQCGHAFARMHSLRKHMVSHSEERNHSCNICGKKFKHLRSVKEHMAIHTGLKNFKCNHCDKAFTFKKNLVVHQRTHTGEKPYTCEICSQGFTQRHCLRGHMKTQHRDITTSTLIQNDSNSLLEEFKSTVFLQ